MSADGCAHVWLAKRAKDAAPFGDVVEVDVAGLDWLPAWTDEPYDPEDPESWQACWHGGDIGPERLRAADVMGASASRSRPGASRNGSAPLHSRLPEVADPEGG